MNNGYELLIEKPEMWAKMLMEVLQDNGIPCTALSAVGAALVIGAGVQERLRVYVPKEHLEQASQLAEQLFSAPTEE